MTGSEREAPERETTEDWSADWAATRARQRRRWSQTSPQQRLDWLEEALAFAAAAGALEGCGEQTEDST